MKKFAGIMVATLLAFSLVACGPVDSAVQNLAGAASNKGSDVVTADDDGYAEGRIGDVMRTYFFDYTVNSAYTCKEFEGYTPAEGNKLLVAETSVYKGYKQDKIEMRGDRAEMSDFPLYLNTVAGGLDRRDQTIGGFSFVVKIYALPVVEIIGQLLYLLGRYGFNTQFGDCP